MGGDIDLRSAPNDGTTFLVNVLVETSETKPAPTDTEALPECLSG